MLDLRYEKNRMQNPILQYKNKLAWSSIRIWSSTIIWAVKASFKAFRILVAITWCYW